MTGYVDNIEKITLENDSFRQVLFTAQHCQVVVMSLLPGEDIGEEVHDIVDQFIRVETGQGKVVMNGEEHPLADGSAIVVPAGTKHNIINTSPATKMKLYTIYSPAHHKDGTRHVTKADALADTADHI